jgi:hypothetical protein
MPYILQASFWVGLIGTAAAIPLLFLAPVEHSYLTVAAYRATSMVVLFFTAAAAFAALYAMLPSSRWRTRIAGSIAGIVTFFGFSLWMAVMINGRTESYLDWPRIVYPFLVMFVFAGWIPISAGWLAGWLVSKLHDTPEFEVV